MNTSKKRVFDAINHNQPDRVPLMYRDVPEVRARLKKDLQIKTDDELYSNFGIDFRWVGPRYTGPELQISETEKKDHWGIEWQFTKFSNSAGYWNEKSFPMEGIESEEEVAKWPLPDLEWWDFSNLSSDCDQYKDFALMTAPGFSSPGILQYPIQSLIGTERSLMDLYINPEFYKAMITRILEFQMPFVEKMMKSAENKIDFFRLGDDFGTQQGLLMGVDQWKEFFQPALRLMADKAKEFSAKYYHHSCGAIRELIPSFIETGVDVLDPVQVKATGMVPAELKKEFGDKICFSGGVDEQDLLPHGTEKEVKEAVWRLLDEMYGNGGFILGPTHNFQDDIPTKNIVAMYDAALNWKG
jgi:uroporphyrinogen decarboxylase